MIKKFTAMLLSVLLLFTFAMAQTADYLGVWYLVSVESGGIALNPTDVGMEMIITLNDDGTGAVASTGEEDMPASWVLDGDVLTITADDEPLAFTLTEEGQLVAEAEGSMMVFGREAAGPSFIPAAEIAAEDIAAFDGTWTITTVNAYGMILPFAAMAQTGMEDAAVVIDNGSIQSLGVEQTGAFVDGKLVVEATETDPLGKSFSLLEDGTLAMNYMDIIFYCEMVEVME